MRKLVFLLIAFPHLIWAQEANEKISPLQVNPKLAKRAEARSLLKRGDYVDTLKLPFFDDFTGSTVFPDSTLWQDYYVYVNNSFPDKPISFNAATFDGLNQFGRPYVPGAGNNVVDTADILTSQYIDLSNITAADSVYLSFFYQSQGNGDVPEIHDSLVLQFQPLAYKGDTGAWVSVWRTRGGSKTDFQIVNIPLNYPDTSLMYHNAFRFRFMAYGNVSGALDHWHIDYVYMEVDRTKDDIYFSDITVLQPITSILKNYRSMPFDQFRRRPQQELRNELALGSRNLFQNLQQHRLGYRIIDKSNGKDVGNEFFDINIDGDYGTLITNYDNNTDVPNIQPQDRVELEIQTSVFLAPDQRRNNDTFFATQVFHNYLAYDDGSAEAGYGIVDGTGCVAIEFEVNEDDTLRGIMLMFNRSKQDVSDELFDLVVWDIITSPGEPANRDEEIARIEGLSPSYGTFRNTFIYYELEEPVAVSDNFYVGWEQTEVYQLNIGLDYDYKEINGAGNLNSNLFYKTNNTWFRTSTATGALMIRPVISPDPIDTVFLGMKKVVQAQDLIHQTRIFPNPGTDHLNIKSTNRIDQIELINLNGEILINHGANRTKLSEINTDALKSGLYLIRIRCSDGSLEQLKWVKL